MMDQFIAMVIALVMYRAANHWKEESRRRKWRKRCILTSRLISYREQQRICQEIRIQIKGPKWTHTTWTN